MKLYLFLFLRVGPEVNRDLASSLNKTFSRSEQCMHQMILCVAVVRAIIFDLFFVTTINPISVYKFNLSNETHSRDAVFFPKSQMDVSQTQL